MTIPKRTEELLNGGFEVQANVQEVNPFNTRTSTWVEASDLEPEILEGIGQIEKMLKCICGRECQGSFNGMPVCTPGTGCATNTGSDGCCCCGDENAAGCYQGESICAPGQGCNSHWNPSNESAEQKIQDHDNWASQTNHGQYAMPGEGPKPQAPWATHSSVNSDW